MKSFFKIINVTFKISKSYFLFVILALLCYLLTTLLLVYTPSLIINQLENGQSFNYLIIYSVCIVLLNILLSLVNNYLKSIVNYKQSYIGKMYYFLMADKVLSIKYEYLEDPDILDLKERAIFAAQNQGAITRALNSSLLTIQNIITLGSLIAIMSQLGGILVLVVILYLIVYLLTSFLLMRKQIVFFKNIVPINRKFGYYIDTLSNPNCVKDYRIYNCADLVLSRTDKFQRESCDEITKLYTNTGIITALATGVRGVIQGFVYLIISNQLFKNIIKASNFSLYTSSALGFINESATFVDNIINLVQSIYYLVPFMKILSLPDEKDEGKHIILDKDINEIEFRNVSFTYPRQEKEVLIDISFKIVKNECISIVGLNGAGKSTLIKLLCRFYKPTKGEILVNGINIYDYDVESYNKHFACVFQDFKLFGYSIKENIAPYEADEKNVSLLLANLGMKDKIASLKHGIDTLYNKQLDEDGIEMSGGQSQKIAIARALYKNSEIVILDEPTSALDPKSEADIYENFNNLTKDKTAIYISHRMSSSTFCDKILVIDGGKVTDFDTHHNLMQKDCLYRTLFNKQAINYLK